MKGEEDDAYSKKKNCVNDTEQRLPKEKKGDTNNNEKSPEKDDEDDEVMEQNRINIEEHAINLAQND